MTTAIMKGCLDFGTDKYQEYRPNKTVERGYIVLNDATPRDLGGFRKGAGIEYMQMEFMLEQKTIALGSTFKRGAKTYRVSLTTRGAYCLVVMQ
jgi:hypothetical protein